MKPTSWYSCSDATSTFCIVPGVVSVEGMIWWEEITKVYYIILVNLWTTLCSLQLSPFTLEEDAVMAYEAIRRCPGGKVLRALCKSLRRTEDSCPC
jgi:hypothetical protein